MIQSRPIFPFTHTWCAYIYSQTLPSFLKTSGNSEISGENVNSEISGENCAGRTYFFNFIREKGGKKTRQISIPPSVMCLTERRKKKTAKEEKEKRREEKKKKEAAGTEEREPIIEGGIDSGFLLKWGCDAVAA